MKSSLLLGLALGCLFATLSPSTAASNGRVRVSESFGLPVYQAERVLPGTSHTDMHGVTVNNFSNSTGNAAMTGDYGFGTYVNTKSGFVGEIQNTVVVDIITLSAGSNAKISGTGASIFVSASSNIHITNTADPLTQPPGTSLMLVYFPDGSTQEVAMGTSVRIIT